MFQLSSCQWNFSKRAKRLAVCGYTHTLSLGGERETHTHTDTRTHTETYKDIDTDIDTDTDTDTETQTQTHMHARIHAHTHAHTYTHTHTHARTLCQRTVFTRRVGVTSLEPRRISPHACGETHKCVQKQFFFTY